MTTRLSILLNSIPQHSVKSRQKVDQRLTSSVNGCISISSLLISQPFQLQGTARVSVLENHGVFWHVDFNRGCLDVTVAFQHQES